jgi:hypothetical protein
MKDEQRLIEIMAELLAEVHTMNEELKQHGSLLREQGADMKEFKQQQSKTNLALGELRLSILKLAERDSIIEDHEQRLKFIETKISKAS